MKIAIVRGAVGTLKEAEIGFLAADADAIVQVPAPETIVSDPDGTHHSIVWAEIDPPEQVLVECMTRIKAAWEATFPDDAHLGHAAQGLWWSYWFSPNLDSIGTLLTQGRVADLRASAVDFISSEFGNLRGPQLDPCE